MSRGIHDIEWYGKKYILEWFKEDGLIQITGVVGGGAEEETYDYKEDDVSAVNSESFKHLEHMKLAVRNGYHISKEDALKLNGMGAEITELISKVNERNIDGYNTGK